MSYYVYVLLDPIAAGTYRHSDEVRKRMSEGKTGERHNFYGKNHSEESKKLISETMVIRANDIDFKKRKAFTRARNSLIGFLRCGLPFTEVNYHSNKPNKFAPSHTYLVNILGNDIVNLVISQHSANDIV